MRRLKSLKRARLAEAIRAAQQCGLASEELAAAEAVLKEDGRAWRCIRA